VFRGSPADQSRWHTGRVGGSSGGTQARGEFEARRRRPRFGHAGSAGRVHALLRTHLRLGEHEANEVLVEEELMRAFGASRTSVREAMAMLVTQGFLVRRPRHGTSVVDQVSVAHLNAPFPFAAGERGWGALVRQLSHQSITATVALQMLLETQSPKVEVFEQQLSRSGRPFAIRIMYIPSEFLPGEVDESSLGIAAPGDHWSVDFENVFGTPARQIDSTVEAAAADRWVADGLNVSLGDPVLSRETIMRGVDNRIRTLSYTYYRANVVALTVTERNLDNQTARE
jgi:GntR family transcriptional regulator